VWNFVLYFRVDLVPSGWRADKCHAVVIVLFWGHDPLTLPMNLVVGENCCKLQLQRTDADVCPILSISALSDCVC